MDLLDGWDPLRPPPQATVLKPGVVWRIGEVVVKHGSPTRLRRAAAAWGRLGPVPTPEPLLLGRNGRQAVLAMRRCPGSTLDQAWHDPAARDALADLLAAMFSRRLIHGDLTPQNLLWDGTRLWLIDLDSLRHALHGMLWRRHLVLTWAWLYHRLPEREQVRAAHDRCCTTLGLGNLERRWAAVMTATRAIAARIARRRAKRSSA